MARMLSHLGAPSGGRFSAAVTPGRNNPPTLKAEPVGDGFAFFVRLTPNGDDDVPCMRRWWSDLPERFGRTTVASGRPPQRMPFCLVGILLRNNVLLATVRSGLMRTTALRAIGEGRVSLPPQRSVSHHLHACFSSEHTKQEFHHAEGVLSPGIVTVAEDHHGPLVRFPTSEPAE